MSTFDAIDIILLVLFGGALIMGTLISAEIDKEETCLEPTAKDLCLSMGKYHLIDAWPRSMTFSTTFTCLEPNTRKKSTHSFTNEELKGCD